MTEREYLVSLGLAKPGRGRFSGAAKEALAKAKEEGKTFTDTKPVVKASPKPAAKPAAKAVPKVDTPKFDAKAVRAWAKDNGIAVPERGRIPNDVLTQYAETDSPQEAKADPNVIYEAPQTHFGKKWFGRVGNFTITLTDKDVCNRCMYSISHCLCTTPHHLTVDGQYVPLYNRPLV